MRWVPFVCACVIATVWCSACRAGHLSTYTTVVTTLLVGLAVDAWMRIPPRGMEQE